MIVADNDIVDDLRDTIKTKNPQLPDNLGANQLVVKLNAESEPLKSSYPVQYLETDEDSPLYVIVPEIRDSLFYY